MNRYRSLQDDMKLLNMASSTDPDATLILIIAQPEAGEVRIDVGVSAGTVNRDQIYDLLRRAMRYLLSHEIVEL